MTTVAKENEAPEVSTTDASKSLPFSEAYILAAASKFDTPFHLYDEKSIRDICRAFKSAFEWCPGFTNYFAVKATPNPHIVKITLEEGFGVDCSSLGELIIAESLGLQGEQIMFTSNNTTMEEFIKAQKLGAIINLDDMSHIDVLSKVCKEGLPEMLSFRYNPGPLRKGNVIIGNPAEAKFGVTTDQLLPCYSRAKEAGVKRFGLHTMVVSNCLEIEELLETAKMMFQLVDQIKTELGIEIELLNLGGGIGVPYRPSEKPIDFAVLGQGVKALYESMILGKGLKPLRIVYECGRCITGPAGVLVSRVTNRKDIYKKYVGVDACMANLMRPGLYGSYHHITVIKDPSFKGNRQPLFVDEATATTAGSPTSLASTAALNCDVVGSLCENNDKLAVNRLLPKDMSIGDLLIVHDTGAHGHAMGFQYNARLRSAEYLRRMGDDDKQGNIEAEMNRTVRIRRAETLADYFQALSGFHRLPGKRWYNTNAVRILMGAIVGSGATYIALRLLSGSAKRRV